MQTKQKKLITACNWSVSNMFSCAYVTGTKMGSVTSMLVGLTRVERCAHSELFLVVIVYVFLPFNVIQVGRRLLFWNSAVGIFFTLKSEIVVNKCFTCRECESYVENKVVSFYETRCISHGHCHKELSSWPSCCCLPAILSIGPTQHYRLLIVFVIDIICVFLRKKITFCLGLLRDFYSALHCVQCWALY